MTHVALDRRFIAWREEEGSAIQRLKDPRLYADDIDWKELQKHARASANLYSLVRCAEVNGLEPYAYLLHLLEELPKARISKRCCRGMSNPICDPTYHMTTEIFDSSVRCPGDLAGVFEYDGENADFYLYDDTREENQKILSVIHVLSGNSDLTSQDVEVRWDDTETRVALFLRGTQWAVFNVVTGEKYGGNYSPHVQPQIPPGEILSGRRPN